MAKIKKKGNSLVVYSIVIVTCLIVLYIFSLLIFKRYMFSYTFKTSLVREYLHSQDIPYYVPGQRYMLSDGDLHIASGYLYVKGADPTQYHFQHTPFLKYLYGYTILLFRNPYYLEILLGILYIVISYFLGLKIYKSISVAALASFLLAVGPLPLMISGDFSFELGQAVFFLLYFMIVFFYDGHVFLSGVMLALWASSKFWGSIPFFLLVIYGYQFWLKKFNVKKFIMHFIIAFLVFSLTYVKTFIDKGGLFNIVFFQLKILKYWLTHSITDIPFASLLLYLTGFYKSWWGSNAVIRGEVWNILWPISFFVSLLTAFRLFSKKQFMLPFLVAIMPVLYLIYLGAQAPYLRYFIIVLPFFYFTLSKFLVDFAKSKFIKTVR